MPASTVVHDARCVRTHSEELSPGQEQFCPWCQHTTSVVGGFYCGCQRNDPNGPFQCRCKAPVIGCCEPMRRHIEAKFLGLTDGIRRIALDAVRDARLARRGLISI